MITALFLIYFFDNNSYYIHADQRIFKTVEECNLFAEGEKERQQSLPDARPFSVIHVCYDWGQDA